MAVQTNYHDSFKNRINLKIFTYESFIHSAVCKRMNDVELDYQCYITKPETN